MCTEASVYSVSGIAGIEWDAVELPSQFMENWYLNLACLSFVYLLSLYLLSVFVLSLSLVVYVCVCRCYDPQTLGTLARHYKTGESMPQEMQQRLRGTRPSVGPAHSTTDRHTHIPQHTIFLLSLTYSH